MKFIKLRQELTDRAISKATGKHIWTVQNHTQWKTKTPDRKILTYLLEKLEEAVEEIKSVLTKQL